MSIQFETDWKILKSYGKIRTVLKPSGKFWNHLEISEHLIENNSGTHTFHLERVFNPFPPHARILFEPFPFFRFCPEAPSLGLGCWKTTLQFWFVTALVFRLATIVYSAYLFAWSFQLWNIKIFSEEKHSIWERKWGLSLLRKGALHIFKHWASF